MENDPGISEIVTIDGKTYTFTEAPNAPGILYAEIGRKAKVFRVSCKGQYYALKTFKPRFRKAEAVENTGRIAIFQDVPGFSVARRTILTPERYPEVIQAHPDFAYGVLMPWVAGKSWYNYVSDRVALSRQDSLKLARALANALRELEQRALAHCDLSSSNFIFSSDFTHVELIDIEDMFGHGLIMPSDKPRGTGGYAPDWVKKDGIWEAGADRFSTGILLSEILAWQFDDIRTASDGDVFFAEGEAGHKSRRFRMMSERLEQIHPELSRLFKTVWYAESVEECPRIADWQRVLDVESDKPEITVVILEKLIHLVRMKNKVTDEELLDWIIINVCPEQEDTFLSIGTDARKVLNNPANLEYRKSLHTSIEQAAIARGVADWAEQYLINAHTPDSYTASAIAPRLNSQAVIPAATGGISVDLQVVKQQVSLPSVQQIDAPMITDPIALAPVSIPFAKPAPKSVFSTKTKSRAKDWLRAIGRSILGIILGALIGVTIGMISSKPLGLIFGFTILFFVIFSAAWKGVRNDLSTREFTWQVINNSWWIAILSCFVSLLFAGSTLAFPWLNIIYNIIFVCVSCFSIAFSIANNSYRVNIWEKLLILFPIYGLASALGIIVHFYNWADGGVELQTAVAGAFAGLLSAQLANYNNYYNDNEPLLRKIFKVLLAITWLLTSADMIFAIIFAIQYYK